MAAGAGRCGRTSGGRAVSDTEQPYTITESAAGLHEVYLSLRQAGFGRMDARWLVACLLKGVPLPDWFADKLRDADPEAEL